MAARKPQRSRQYDELELDRFSPLLDAQPASTAQRWFEFKSRVWRWQSTGGWHFANLPVRLSADLRAASKSAKRGWGSIPVRVRIGETDWETSLFPHSKTRSYLFAIKADVRRAEGLVDGSRISVSLAVR